MTWDKKLALYRQLANDDAGGLGSILHEMLGRIESLTEVNNRLLSAIRYAADKLSDAELLV